MQLTDTSATHGLGEVGDSESRSARHEQLGKLADQIDELLSLLPGRRDETGSAPSAAAPADPLEDQSVEVAQIRDRVQNVQQRLDALNDERAALTRHLSTLTRLMPLVPELADLDAADIGALRLATAVLVLNTDDDTLVETLRLELAGLLGGRFELVTMRVDQAVIGCLVVFPRSERDAVQTLLGQAQVRKVELPERFERMSLHAAVRAMQCRLDELPAAEASAKAELRGLLRRCVACETLRARIRYEYA